MAIRTLKWTVGENMEVSPTSIQKAGVQGDHLATCVEFTVPGSLQDGYVLYIQFVSSTGEYDKTDALTVADGKVSFLLPLAWTQDGGRATLRLVATKDNVPEGVEPETVYSTDGRIVFEEHQTGFARVKSLISGAINRLMELAKKAKDDAAESASLAQEAERKSKEASDAAKEAAAGALTNAQSAEESAGQAKSYRDETIYGHNAVMTMRDEVSGKAEQAETSARLAEESAASVAADLQESIKSAAAAAISEQNSQNSAASAYESEQNSQQSATSAADSAQRAEAASAIALEAKVKAEQSAASINTVDQTFDPLSENPQSGIAIAESMKEIGGLVYSATIPDDVTVINILQDNNGNPLKLSRYTIIVAIKASESLKNLAYLSSKIQINSEGKYFYMGNQTVIGGGIEGRYHIVLFDGRIENSGWIVNSATYKNGMISEGGKIYENSSAILDGIGYYIPHNKLTYDKLMCTKISLNPTGSSSVIPAGTIVEVYGK